MLVSTFVTVALASSLAGLVTTIGIWIIGRYEAWGISNTVYFMSFAAGVLIAVPFIHIIPKSIEMNASAPIFLLVGFLALYLINRFVTSLICHRYEATNYTIGIIPMLGIGLHSFLDGVIYSVTFNVSVFTGILAAVGMVLHEFPEGIVTFLLLKRGGFSRQKAQWIAFLAAALSTPFGALGSYPWMRRIPRSTLGMWLAFSAGALLYVGAAHLLPAVEKENKRYSVISMAAGILVAVVIVVIKE